MDYIFKKELKMKRKILCGFTALTLFPMISHAQQKHEIIPPPSFSEKKEVVKKETSVEANLEEKVTQNRDVLVRKNNTENSAKTNYSERETVHTQLATIESKPVVESKDESDVVAQPKNTYATKSKSISIKDEQDISMKNIQQVKRDPVHSTPRVPHFSAKRNEMLSSVLSKWAEQEGWTLQWSYSQDFRLPADIQTSGSIEETFEKISRSLISEGIDLSIKLYRSNKVILVR
jgi:hypothetical protein